MKKSLSWWTLLIVAIVSYFLGYVIGGIVGGAFSLLGLIVLVLAIVRGITTAIEKKKSEKK